jgi:hypothetical protein
VEICHQNTFISHAFLFDHHVYLSFVGHDQEPTKESKLILLFITTCVVATVWFDESVKEQRKDSDSNKMTVIDLTPYMHDLTNMEQVKAGNKHIQCAHRRNPGGNVIEWFHHGLGSILGECKGSDATSYLSGE